jgi:hypothetical protein
MSSHNSRTLFFTILVLCTCCKSDKVFDDGYFQEKDGIVVFEAECIKLTKGWLLENSIKDYSGEGYITWKDSTIIETNNQGLLRYDFQITTQGIYTLKMRNYHSCEDFTECNDVFVKLDNGDWRKNFNHTLSSWDWNSQQDLNHVFSNSEFNLNKGIHTLYLSGRSKNFSIDKIAIFHQDLTKGEYKKAALSEYVKK